MSTRHQDVQPQVDALHAAGCERVYTEVASGSSPNRAQLAAALDYCRPGDTFVVTSLDRFGRTIVFLMHTVEAMRRRGVRLQTLREGMDTDNPQGRILYVVSAMLAEVEAILIRERAKEASDAARANGRMGGRTPALTGRRRERARKMLADGASIHAVARKFEVSRATIHRTFPAEVAARAAGSADPAAGGGIIEAPMGGPQGILIAE